MMNFTIPGEIDYYPNNIEPDEFENESLYLNKTLEEYLLFARGPRYLPLKLVIPLSIIYCALFLTGVLGNAAVCVVIVSNTSMHTSTNFYLFSLALSDLALLILGLPNDLSIYWQQYPWIFGQIICKMRAMASEMSSYVSVLTIVAFSLERYVAICYPLTSYKADKFSRVIKVIASLWIVSLISALPFAVFTTVNFIEYPPGTGRVASESAMCAMLQENVPPNLPIYELSSFLFFILPACMLTYLYIRIGIEIRRNTSDSSIHKEFRRSQSRTSIVYMLMAVVIAFFVCWAPFHLQRLMYVYMSDHSMFHDINMWLYYITGMLYYLSATINPILYNVMSIRYRTAFKQTLFCKKKSNYNSLARTSSNRETNNRTTEINKLYSQSSPINNRITGGDFETKV